MQLGRLQHIITERISNSSTEGYYPHFVRADASRRSASRANVALRSPQAIREFRYNVFNFVECTKTNAVRFR